MITYEYKMTGKYSKDSENVLEVICEDNIHKLNYAWDENNGCYHASDSCARSAIKQIFQNIVTKCSEDNPTSFLHFFPTLNKMFIDYINRVSCRMTPLSKNKVLLLEKLSFTADLKLKFHIYIPEDDPSVGHLIEKVELFENDELIITSTRF